MQLKAVIVDDEELARSAIANLIAQNDEVI